MAYITTYTGEHFDPLHPDIDLIKGEDAAHALSLICRGNGHVTTFFSVGQHCINCCKEAMERGYSDRVALACLVHDASEAYMSDVPRPLKQLLPEYVEAEKKLLALVYEHFLGSKITDEEEKMVKEIDDDMLYYDMYHLLHEKIKEEEPKILITLFYDERPFSQVEKEYLELLHKLLKRLGRKMC